MPRDFRFVQPESQASDHFFRAHLAHQTGIIPRWWVVMLLGKGKVNLSPSPERWCWVWAHHTVPGQGRGRDSNSGQAGSTKGVGWHHQRQHGANIAKKHSSNTWQIQHRWYQAHLKHATALVLWYYTAESLQGFLLKELPKRNSFSHWCFVLVKMRDKKVLVKQWGGSDF